jgi:small conductance mechanosensitive channel
VHQDAAGQAFGARRTYNELLKQVFDERGIEIPFPHPTVYWGEGKDGTAPPFRIQTVGTEQ